MEDACTVESGGRFVAVFDGHGGNVVSSMLRDNLYRIYRKKLIEIHAADGGGKLSQSTRTPTASSHVQAIREALQTIETEVMTREDLVYQVRVAFGFKLHHFLHLAVVDWKIFAHIREVPL